MIAHLLSAMFFMRGKVWLRGPLSNCLTLRRLRGGVKIRVSEFLGGGKSSAVCENSPPPATALSRTRTPPRKRRGVKVSGCLKTILSASHCPQENR